MASFLAQVKNDVKEVFDAAFEELWSEILEPSLKESYSNGLAAGKKRGNGKTEDQAPESQGSGRRFRRSSRAGSER